MKKFSYHQRLAKLKLESLELRRLHADLLFTYKLVFGIIDLKRSDFFYRKFPFSKPLLPVPTTPAPVQKQHKI